MRIELAGVRKRYGKVVALDRIDLDIPSGARVALLGTNGSGKTTLTRVVMGLVGHEGTLRLGGAPAVPRRPELAARTAYVPQIAPPWSAPVGDVVAAIAALRGLTVPRIAEACARMGLELGRVARRPFRGLSGGTKQKLLIALALAARPQLAVLDEPTASLDAIARARFLELAQGAWGGATLLLCSHRLDELRALVDHVVVLADGRIAWSGPAERYLAEHVTAILELRIEGGDDTCNTWLHAHGFRPAAPGWWRRAVDGADKLAVIPTALAALGGRVRDLALHDTEKLDA